MSKYVVDASVGIKWFIPEIHSEEARKALRSENELHISEFFYVECANILWKKSQRKEIENNDAILIFGELENLPLEVHATTPNILLALEIAQETGRTVYDCLYIALAKEIDAVMITADERLFNALSNTKYVKYCSCLVA